MGSKSKPVLIVEDDIYIMEAYKDILASEGYQTLVASNGLEALRILSTLEKPCLVLLDMMMPVMGGKEFMEQLLLRADILPLPVVILSGQTADARSLGAVKWIRKPIGMNELIKIVGEYCGTC